MNNNQNMTTNYNQPMNNMQMPYGNGQMMAPQTTININKDFVMKGLGVICGVMLLLGLFVPFVDAYGSKQSLWDYECTFFNILFIVFSIIPVVTFLIQKLKHISYLSAGFGLSITTYMLGALDGFEYVGFGFWLILIASIVLIVVCVIDDAAEIKTLFAPRMVMAPVMPVAQAPQAPQAPQMSQAAPASNAVVCRHCGQPQKNPEDQFCQSCGKKYE